MLKTTLAFAAAAAAISASPAIAQSMFTGSGPGAFSSTTSGDTATFTFADNNPGNAYNGLDNWTFSSVANQSGTYSFSYDANGFSAYFRASAYANAFNGDSSQNLYNMTTFGGYSNSGTFSLNLIKGETYGIMLGGKNYDSDAQINGTFKLTSNAIGAVPEPATWAMMLLGFGMIGFGMRYRRKSTKVSFA